ncbi:partial imidazoleglycerol-phosphate dehydratase, partial [Planctomycetaceae bacterium]
MSRKATIERVTKETQIKLSLEIDGTGEAKICTSVPFL